MTLEEFSNQFDVYYNNITSNQAPGLNEYEKSVYLTKAQNEIVKNHFSASSKGNELQQGFDDSAKRQADFSCLLTTYNCNGAIASGTVLAENGDNTETSVINESNLSFSALDAYVPLITINDLEIGARYTVTKSSSWLVISTDKGAAKITGFPYVNGGYITRKAANITNKIDYRSSVFSFPSDVFIPINEVILTTSVPTKILQVIPLRYDDYTRLMSKPFKRPLKNQAWRLINTGMGGSVVGATKYVEIITNLGDTVNSYDIRYIRTPHPIILEPLDGLSIGGYKGKDENGTLVQANDTVSTVTSGIECELDPVIHEEILQRAVELAKVAWTATSQDNAQMVIQTGQRSE